MNWNKVAKLIKVQENMNIDQFYKIMDEEVVKSFEKLDAWE